MADVSPTSAADDVAGEGAATFRLLCHELRQPLGVAMGYVTMLEDGAFGELPEEARGVITTVVARLDALNELIEQGLARAAEDRHTAEPERDAVG